MTNGFEARQHAGASDLNIVTVMLKKTPLFLTWRKKNRAICPPDLGLEFCNICEIYCRKVGNT